MLSPKKYNKRTKLLISIAIGIGFFLSACTKDEPEDPIIPNEEELITTFVYTLETLGGGTSLILSFQDLDGDGGEAPIITVSGPLAAGQSYTGQLTLLNENSTPVTDISEEVSEEAEDHQFFFQTSGLDLGVSYEDSDMDGNPIGLNTSLMAGFSSMGTLRITLRHLPDKNADGVAQGAIENAGGETDIEVVFDVEIQ